MSSKYHCCVPGCNADKQYNEENKLSFHRFPPVSKKELGAAWINNTRRDPGENFEVNQCCLLYKTCLRRQQFCLKIVLSICV